uniref:Uncharacterized protein n=1 Tax=Candidatus Kentrum sp. LFY TaxID=2126342 RepID=A0A450UNV9_9GAMM|nr:MAG: hypothetical protein BECKLFY1418A_GA0070994_103815 [Candidatus Kentron sp. LFY]
MANHGLQGHSLSLVPLSPTVSYGERKLVVGAHLPCKLIKKQLGIEKVR